MAKLIVDVDMRKTKKAIDDMVYIVRRLNSNDFVKSTEDVVERVKDILRMISRDNDKKKSIERLRYFYSSNAHIALFFLFDSSIRTNRVIGEKAIRLFLNPEIGCYLPKYLQNHCAFIVSQFCLFITTTPAYGGPLYNSCSQTLASSLKSIGFANRSRYFDNAKASDLIEVFYPFVQNTLKKLIQGLDSIKMSSSSSSSSVQEDLGLTTFESDICEFGVFSLHLIRAIEDHFRSQGQSLPICIDDNFYKHPCYLKEIKWFNSILNFLRKSINVCLFRMAYNTNEAGFAWEFHHGWSYYLPILKELNTISKLYQGAEEELVSLMRSNKYQLHILVMLSKRSDDHQWLLKHKNTIDFKYRRHLLMMMMFPEVNCEGEKPHKMLIDRSQLLTDSFDQHIALSNPKSLRNGLFVEFKNEVATGNGVLREWLFLVCQALFHPKNSLFLACPYDRRRFFPNPAKVDPHHLNYFRFCGQMIALALMHKVQVGIAFDRVFFLKLAGKQGISLEDISNADPCMYKSCKKILEMDADFMDSDELGMTFIQEIEESGSRKVVELCPGGKTIVVNSKNREEYVHLLIQHCFVKSISEKVACFALGFGDILCKRRLHKIFFQSLELKDLDCMLLGSDKPICVKDWKAHTEYDYYKDTDDQICWFWKVVEGMSLEQQRGLLFFWTSVKYLPVNGFSGLPSPLYIYKKTSSGGSHYRLPSSHTCFYRLALPHYPSFAVMQQSLFLVCQEDVGCSFGFL